MPRPKKCRRVGFIPDITEFVPEGNNIDVEIVVLTVEELESLRLIDLNELDQEKSAEAMDISRGTIQRILNSARKKVSDALINGKKIIIEGGNYNITECKYFCKRCGKKYKSEKNIRLECPSCGNEDYICRSEKGFCKKNCNRYKGGEFNG